MRSFYPFHKSRSFSLLIVCGIAVLTAAGCKGSTHITGTVKNKWGSPIYLATVTLRQGEHTQTMQTSQDGRFDIALDHSPFKVELKLTATSDIYETTEKSFSSSVHLKTIDLTMEERPEPTLAEVRRLRLNGINAKRAGELAELMCRQLPNTAAFPMKSFLSGDDVHDTLVLLSGIAQPCLIDHLTDSGWMPDSRSEPLADFHAGDAALWILSDAGLDFEKVIVPLIDPKKWKGAGVYEYFYWVNQGNHRKVVQQAVKDWLQQHPECCGKESPFSSDPDSAPISKISPQRFAELRQVWAKLKPEMDENLVRQILGTPDAEGDPEHADGVIAINRFEKSAALYVVENRTSKAGKLDFWHRDFLRDRYVVVFYSSNGKFVRAFSNVPELPPIYPRSETLWTKMIYASMGKMLSKP